MSSTFTLCDPIDFFTFLAGLFLLLKKVSEADRYQTLWTLVMTTIFGSIVLYFFLLIVSGPIKPFNCWDDPLCTP